jgi:UDP-glucose 4-epimerase
MKIFITGGTGYIASHTALSLLDLGHDVILFDNLSNSSVDTVGNIKTISNKDVSFILGDLSDTKLLSKTIRENKIEMVIHFAA